MASSKPDATHADPVDVYVSPVPDGTEIVLVDDDRDMVHDWQRFLEGCGYPVRAFTDPLEALDAIRERAPSVLLTDKDMPGMSGLELSDEALGEDPDIGIIVVTGAGDEASAQAALRVGAVDYLTKPVDLDALERSVQRAARRRAQEQYARTVRSWLQEEVGRQTERIREVTLGTLASFGNALEAKSPHFEGHSQSVASSAAGIARALHMSEEEIEAIRTAGLLHDVGMIAVPEYLLDKAEPLEEEEYAILQGHCQKGAEILKPMAHLGPSIKYILEHHERLDGSGYPEGKRGNEISPGGQIVGLAEAWTAILEGRSYRPPLSRAEALETIDATSGTWFTPELIKALRDAQSE